MTFSSQFARTLPAAARAFGFAARYRRGADEIDITLSVGPRDLAQRNSLGSEFAHVNTKEFVLPAASLSIDGEVFLPEAGHELVWTPPNGTEQTWIVFPLWNDRSFDRLDVAETQLRLYAVSAGDVSSISLPVAGGSPRQLTAIAGLLGTTEVTVTTGSREKVSDRDTCRILAVCPPGTFATDMRINVARYPGGEFYVRTVENIAPTSTRLELWREAVKKIQRSGTEGGKT
jgi:hypothetical protein